MYIESGFDYLRQKFPRISEAKINEDIFVGPQVKQLFQEFDFKNKFNGTNRRACDAFENVCSSFLGNKKFRKLDINRGGAASLIQCLGVQNVVDIPFPVIPIGFFSREIWDPSLTSRVKVSIRIYPE
jgi:hypothetical protein